MKKSQIALMVGVTIVAIACVVVTIIALQKPTTTERQPRQTTQNDTSSHEASDTVTITYTDSGFSPDSYMVKAGGTVTVINKSSRDLEFSSDNHPTHTDETELNMDTLSPGKSGTFTVTKVGTWGFHNHLTPQDIGSLMVM